MNNFRIAFHIGSFNIYWYPLFAFFAIILVSIITLIEAKRRKLPLKPLEIYGIIALIVGFIFARIWYVIGNHSQIHSITDVFAIWGGGIAIEGGVVGATITAIIYFPYVSRKYEIKVWQYVDILLINLFLAQSIGRWGNFFNQEILGPNTGSNSFIISILPNFIKDHLHLVNESSNVYRQPFFLYESLYCFFCWLILTILYIVFHKYRKNKIIKYVKFGTLGIMWFVLYGLIRSIMEMFRDNVDILKVGPIPISEVLSILFILFGIVIILLNQNVIKIKYWQKNIVSL